MGASKGIGAILLVLSVLFLTAAVLYMFTDSSPLPAVVNNDANLSGYSAGAAGAVCLILGVVLMMVGPKTEFQHSMAPSAAAPQQDTVAIKRTQMNWGSERPRSPAEDLQDRLEKVQQKIGRAKVQYGLGEISNSSYTAVMADLERQQADIERQVREIQDA